MSSKKRRHEPFKTQGREKKQEKRERENQETAPNEPADATGRTKAPLPDKLGTIFSLHLYRIIAENIKTSYLHLSKLRKV